MNIMSQNLFTVLSTLAKNPAVLDDPRLKVLIYKYAEMLGVSTQELELADQKAQANVNQVPGQMPGQPVNNQPNEIPNIRQVQA
jgi:hypothetical protein